MKLVINHTHNLEPVCAFLKICFNRGVGPTLWVKSIINTIPKDRSKCIFTPLNYRGISLLCIISARINHYCDILNIFVEEKLGIDRTVHALIIFSPLQHY